jgi:aspartate carbamoyltransferase regulatory subunit
LILKLFGIQNQNSDKVFSKVDLEHYVDDLSSRIKSEQEFSHIINKYTKLDPALPRVTNVLCPNDNCPTNNKDEEREIIYIRYDNLNMKYVYLCATCDTVWKTEEQS